MVRVQKLQISGKTLGEMALKDFCPRCFWVKLKCFTLPYQIFPGIFASIDSYTKRVIHAYFEKYNALPMCFDNAGITGEPVKVPSHRRFSVIDANTDVVLTGVPDEILRKSDASYMILDYKTSRLTDNQDHLFPMYAVQLNAYAHIAERSSFSPISELALIYCEPITAVGHSTIDGCLSRDGFLMQFVPKVFRVNREPDTIQRLLRDVRGLYELSTPPSGVQGCKNCASLNRLLSVF